MCEDHLQAFPLTVKSLHLNRWVRAAIATLINSVPVRKTLLLYNTFHLKVVHRCDQEPSVTAKVLEVTVHHLLG